MRKFAAIAVFAASLGSSVHAQTAAIPDPGTVDVPDLSNSSDTAVVNNGWKYFFFQRDGATFEEAYRDFADCYRFLQPNGWATVRLNRFVPWNSAPGTKSVPPTNPAPYGLVGALIGEMVEGTLVRRDYQAKMRRCLEPRGYIRYGVAEETWDNVSKLPKEQWVAVQAKIASSPSFGGKVPVK